MSARRASLGALTPPPVASGDGSLDFELLRLGEQFEVAWKIENAACNACPEMGEDEDLMERYHQPMSDLVDRIKSTQTTTLQGLRVKGRAILCCVAGDIREVHADMFGDTGLGTTTDCQIAA